MISPLNRGTMGTGIQTTLMLLAVALVVQPARTSVITRLSPARARRSWTTGPGPGRADAEDPLAVATVLDLLAACLRAGLPTAAAVGAVAPGAPARLRAALDRTADLLALGADPAIAWSAPAVEKSGPPTEFEALARLARRSARSGSSLAVAVGELAGQRRATVEDEAAARAERAGVLISGPLGLCFLPAFICLGIVPVVIGLATSVLGGGLL